MVWWFPATQNTAGLEWGARWMDDGHLPPQLDFNFGNGTLYCHRVAAPAAVTFTRASEALFFQNPCNIFDQVRSLSVLYGNNVPRYGGGPILDPTWIAAGYSIPERYTGLLIEGADQNVITNNTQYAAPNWTLAGCTCADNTDNPIYDGRCFRLTAGAGEGYIQQTKLLTAEKYVLCFLLGVSSRVPDGTFIRAAAGVSGAIAGISTTFEEITHGVYLAWAVFTATAANWDIGVNIRAGAGNEYIGLISCYKAAPANRGGDFPRSPIPSGAAATTRATDIFDIAMSTGMYGPSQGTIDIEAVAPCSLADSGGLGTFFFMRKIDDTSYVHLRYDHTTNQLKTEHVTGGVNRAMNFSPAGIVRGDIMKFRYCYNIAKVDGTNYQAFWSSRNGGAWNQDKVSSQVLGGNLVIEQFRVGRASAANRELDSVIRRIRIYNYSIAGAPEW